MVMKHFLFITLGVFASAQTLDHKKAPNSYIYDIDKAQQNGYGGIFIPVKKAYEMWKSYPYLKANNIATPIPAGIQYASVVWEDNPGMIEETAIKQNATPEDSEIVVKINRNKGKGNAVIAFHVNDKIYWSWHIWVTDNPENGVNYTQGIETDKNLNKVSIVYMDRNLGATSNSFLGHDWDKSGGLLYEWGRKDPFPPLVYKDKTYYEVSNSTTRYKHKYNLTTNPNVENIPVTIRPFNEIEKNIQYSVQNPFTYIINSDATGNWFSNQRHKVAGTGTDYTTWDLWSDNYRGGNSNGSSSNATLRNDSNSYELKSELDPCPDGWRIPSYMGRVTTNNNLSPWGRRDSGVNDDTNTNAYQLLPAATNSTFNGVKVYPGLGFDFTRASNGNRNLGIIPTAGAYVYYPNSVLPTAAISTVFQDESNTGTLWSATYGFDGARGLDVTSDPARTTISPTGLHTVKINNTFATKTGNSVRCIKDPNIAIMGQFATQYFEEQREDFTEGLDNPNSYILEETPENILRIPVSKAFAVYNQILSNYENRDERNLVAKVLWTTNKNIIKSIQLIKNEDDPRLSEILVSYDPAQKGSAVVSLHNKTTTGNAYWSWHLWSPNGNPTESPITYSTEEAISSNGNFINPTLSLSPPMTTTFMDRDLGAIEAFPDEFDPSLSLRERNTIAGNSHGFHYQWGRKDPIPSFQHDTAGGNSRYNTFLGSDNSTITNTITYTNFTNENLIGSLSKEYNTYKSVYENPYKNALKVINYSIQNPLSFMYHSGTGQLYNGANHYSNNINEVRDWVSNEKAILADRWGHATKKSVFDPCPEGWRVPDTSYVILYNGSKGNSPFYNGYTKDSFGKQGVIQDQWQNLTTQYNGKTVSALGWSFKDANYYVGNFPMSGIRGELGGNSLSRTRSGFWTAALADSGTGFALAMMIQDNQVQTGTGAYPQAGMPVRCAKDEPRLLGATIQKIPVPINSKNGDYLQAIPKYTTSVFPNPTKDIITVSTEKEIQDLKMYSISGQQIKTNIVEKKPNSYSVSMKDLPQGLYILSVTSDNQSLTYKIIKN